VLYGAGYMAACIGKRAVATAVVKFNLLAASLVALLVARDGALLLVAWEVMSIVSFFLVVFGDGLLAAHE
jgi:hydrogenase-4 component B